ncbi:EPIDERMAL PATTERNING FACTOR protein 6 [Spatholobus suberectus]|nr:EPIDERMAL PATTERNING FACTOR protein 6 [Spatholobus suberectus]
MGWSRRLQGGPGSSSPQCTSKCGEWTPCKPVLVTMPPVARFVVIAPEHYSQAWRCKCCNKFYKP